jgi:hypothetical protein
MSLARGFATLTFQGGSVSKNVEMSVSGNTLTITVDMAQSFGPSKSGKTVVIATTEGNITIPGTESKIGLNIYKYPDSKPDAKPEPHPGSLV